METVVEYVDFQAFALVATKGSVFLDIMSCSLFNVKEFCLLGYNVVYYIHSGVICKGLKNLPPTALLITILYLRE
jgi:hypothetical protein